MKKDTLVQLRILSPQKAAVSYKCCINASWRHSLRRSTMPHSYSLSSSASSSESWNTSVVSFARGWGCRPILDFALLWWRGDDLSGEACNTERFGSSAELRFEIVLELASRYKSTRCWGPKENVEPIDPRCLELDDEGREGIGGIAKRLDGGGVEVMVVAIRQWTNKNNYFKVSLSYFQ